MSDISIFQDKETLPTQKALSAELGPTFALWERIEAFVMEQYPGANAEWNYPGKKYGWSYRIKDKKRAIIYFLPRSGYFKVAFVFGQKAYDHIMDSDISETIKVDLSGATRYAEGRGIRIDVKDEAVVPDIFSLVRIKIEH